jgi:acetyltransferase-like isoleucine patch superfamily enzyme
MILSQMRSKNHMIFIYQLSLCMKVWLKRNYYRLAYKKKNIEIRRNVLLNTRNEFEGWNVICDDCQILSSRVGLATYVGPNSKLSGVSIGRFCSVGQNLITGVGIHPSGIFVSTHPAFFSAAKQSGFSFVKETIFSEHKYIYPGKEIITEIGNDVWIGHNVIIMDGIKIGDGAIIGAGSVVTKDVLPYTIVAGVPAKLKRYRFTEQQIEKLLTIKWWDWDFEKIKSQSHLFNNIELFISSLD